MGGSAVVHAGCKVVLPFSPCHECSRLVALVRKIVNQ